MIRNTNVNKLRRYSLRYRVVELLAMALCLIIIYGLICQPQPTQIQYPTTPAEYVLQTYHDDVAIHADEVIYISEVLDNTWVVFFYRYVDHWPWEYLGCAMIADDGEGFYTLFPPFEPRNKLGIASNDEYFSRFGYECFIYYSTTRFPRNIEKVLLNGVPMTYIEYEPDEWAFYYLVGRADDPRFETLPVTPEIVRSE